MDPGTHPRIPRIPRIPPNWRSGGADGTRFHAQRSQDDGTYAQGKLPQIMTPTTIQLQRPLLLLFVFLPVATEIELDPDLLPIVKI